MPLEYITVVPDPFLLMYSSDPVHWKAFHTALVELSQGKIDSFGVHQLPGWEGIGGCSLTARLSGRDRGIWRIGELAFECSLTRLWWENCEDMVAAFMDTQDWTLHRHQYVFSPAGQPNLEWCLSTNKEW